jgi:hypothetical protein
MCDPGGAVQQAFEDVGDTAESVVRGANDAIDSGIRGVGGSIEQAAPYVIAATAAYFGIPPEMVTASELESAYAAGTITAEQYATANAAIGMAGETASGVYASASEIAAAQAGAAGTVAGTSGMGASGSPFFDQATIDLSGPGTTSFVPGGAGAPMAGAGAATAAEQAAAQQELLDSVAGATAAGVTPVTASGGVFDNFLNYVSGITPSSAASGLNTVSNLLKTGSALTGIGSGINSIMNPGMSPTQAQNTADPFASSRQQYINQLNAVMANPSLTMSQPGYQFQYQQGLQGLNRKLAKSGMSTDTPGQPGVPASGAAGIAQQAYGQQYALGSYNDYVKQLSGLAGAGQLPGVGGQAALTAQTAAQKQAQTGWDAVGQGVGALSTAADKLGKYMGGGAPPQQPGAPVVNGVPSWNTPQLVPETIAPSGWSSGYDVPSQDTSSWMSGFDLFN